MIQTSLFQPPPPGPPGLDYRAELLSLPAEQALVDHLAALPLRAFEFQGFVGRRRVCSFGWRYDFNDASFRPTEPMPDWLLHLRMDAAEFAGLTPETLEQALVTEYQPGAGIGWHRDRSVFDHVVGVSLLSPCVLRFRRRREGGFDRISVPLASRSAYLLRGEARTTWEHGIAPGEQLRYSVTFRSLRQAGANPTNVRIAP